MDTIHETDAKDHMAACSIDMDLHTVSYNFAASHRWIIEAV